MAVLLMNLSFLLKKKKHCHQVLNCFHATHADGVVIHFNVCIIARHACLTIGVEIDKWYTGDSCK